MIMAEAYNFLDGSQTDINRRLLRRIIALEKATGSEGIDIGELETIVGDSSSGLVKDVSDLQTDVGKDDTSANSLKKRCKDIETTIGADDTSGVRKRVKDVETAIGDEDTEGTILYRIKQLEPSG